MRINWFPGHMVTARKDALQAMRQTDVVIEVLDARVPRSSCNPLVETLRKENQRPALKILNKIDLADPALTPSWLDDYNARPSVRAIALSAKNRGDVSRILAECRALVPGRGTVQKPLRMMILGVPNVGKSTLMNSLLRRKVAKVGDEPAITKMHMRHDVDATMWLVDTPGMLWPGVDEAAAYRLAATHSIGRNAYEEADVAMVLAEYLMRHYPAALPSRYAGVSDAATGEGVLMAVASARKLVGKGGTPDLAKAATVVLNDFRNGVLGRITLETPHPGGA
jgi:ribosome biogenesis GTPase A